VRTAPPRDGASIRIAILLDRWASPGGGLEAWLRAIVPVWTAQGHEALLIARNAEHMPPAGAIPVPAAARWPLPRPWRDRADARARVAAALTHEPDAVLDLRAAHCCGAVWFAMGGFGPARESSAPSARRRALLALEESSVRIASAAVAPSPLVAAALRAFAPDLPLALLPLPLLAPVPDAPGPDADALAGRRPLRIFFCGRDPQRHGLAPALAWFALIRRTLPQAVLEVWSRGATRAPGVQHHGWSGGFRAALARADLLIHPTAYDSFSLACLEAAAAGVPVLTTTQAGAAALLPPELCATVARADATAAAGAALILLRSVAALPPSGRAEMRARLRADHDLGRHADQLAAFLASHPWTG
jgi:hypothetical protein